MFPKMGTCHCNKKLKIETSLDLLPSKLTLKTLFSENKRKKGKDNTHDYGKSRRSSCSVVEEIFEDSQGNRTQHVIINQNIVVRSCYQKRVPFGDLYCSNDIRKPSGHISNKQKSQTNEPQSAPPYSKNYTFHFPTSRCEANKNEEKNSCYTRRDTLLVSDNPESIIYNDKDSNTEKKIVKGCSKTRENFSTPTMTNCTPVKPNHLTKRNTLLMKNLALERKNESPKTADERGKNYVGDIYNMDYLEDIFEGILRDELKIKLKKSFLKKYNPEKTYRLKVVNWLLKIQQGPLEFTDSDFYLSVSFLDHVLASVEIPSNMYQLTALTCLWLATKLNGTFAIDASELLKLTNGSYTKEQMNRMEKKILRIFDFHFHTIEPSLCIFYYLKMLDLEDNELMKITAMYILDCMALTPEFSSTAISKLSAGVIKFTLHLYLEQSTSVVDILESIFKEEDLTSIKHTEKAIESQLKMMNSNLYIAREPYRKYSRENILCASKVLEKRMLELAK